MSHPPIIDEQRDLLRRLWKAEALRDSSEGHLTDQRGTRKSELLAEVEEMRKRIAAFEALVDTTVEEAKAITLLPPAVPGAVGNLPEPVLEGTLASLNTRLHSLLADLLEASEVLEQYRAKRKHTQETIAQIAAFAALILGLLAIGLLTR